MLGRFMYTSGAPARAAATAALQAGRGTCAVAAASAAAYDDLGHERYVAGVLCRNN